MSQNKKTNDGASEIEIALTNKFRLDKIDENITYYGEAIPNTDENSLNWLIVKFTFLDGEIQAMDFAGGSRKFDKNWTKRAEYTYT